jgi:hypothetical protein
MSELLENRISAGVKKYWANVKATHTPQEIHEMMSKRRRGKKLNKRRIKLPS